MSEPISNAPRALIISLLFVLGIQSKAEAHQPFEINPGISALWVDQADSGHGVMLELLTPKLAWMCWFVSDLDKNSAWICGLGSINGDTIEFEAFTVEGGVFPPVTDMESITEVAWGTITIVFSDCNNGLMSWFTEATGFQTGSMALQRLSGLYGLDCESFLPLSELIIPNTGISPVLDGIQSPGEWDDAVQIDIEVNPGWVIPVLLQVGDNALHAAFTNIAGPNDENRVNAATNSTLFPELFFDTTADDTSAWNSDNHWFHTSFQDCYGNGTWRIVNRCDFFGNSWDGTNWPLAPGQTVIEIQIDFSVLGLAPGQAHVVNFFATVTSSLLGDFVYKSWPDTAEAAITSTWQRAILEK